MADFDQGQRNALRSKLNILGDVIHGCSYHWVELIRSAVKRYDLGTLYNSNSHFYNWARMLQMLKDVPPARVQTAFEILYDKIEELCIIEEYKEKVKLFKNFCKFVRIFANILRIFVRFWRIFQNFCKSIDQNFIQARQMMTDYVSTQWLHNKNYPIESWNTFRRIINTNGFAEGNNYKLKAYIGHHPSFWNWLSSLKEISALQTIQWKYYLEHGLTDLSSLDQHIKNIERRILWRFILKNKSDKDLWKYMKGMKWSYAGYHRKWQNTFGRFTERDIR